MLLTASRDSAGLGRLYASAVLGITALSYVNSDAAGTEPALRQTRFAVKAQQILRTASDKEMVAAGALTLLHQGAVLWADGKLDWDYTSLGKPLLAAAKEMAPENMRLKTAQEKLLRRSERPPMTIRVGGNVQSLKLVRQPKPPYPREALNLGIQGTVRFNALIGLDGRILHLDLV